MHRSFFVLVDGLDHIEIRAEIALGAGIFVISRAHKAGRKRNAGHQRCAGAGNILCAVRQGEMMVCKPHDGAMGTDGNGNKVRHQPAERPDSQPLIPAGYMVAHFGIQVF